MQKFRNLFRQNKATATSPIIGMGIIVGVVIGYLTDNVGLWIALGLVFGAAIEAARIRLRK